MNKLNIKQKIILLILSAIIVFGIGYYIYANGKNEESIMTDNIQEIEENSNTEEKDNSDKNENKIIVHVSGSVVQEGVVELNSNMRVSDAIEKAGGVKEDADMSKINLAYILEDGMKIYIPSKNDKDENLEYDKTNNYIQGSDVNLNADLKSASISNSNINTTSRSGIKSNTSSKKININKATQTELETLPGIGPSTATKIINYRNENVKFNNIEDLKKVSGIGDSKYNNIKDLICVK